MKIKMPLVIMFCFMLFNCSSDDNSKKEIQPSKPLISFKEKEKRIRVNQEMNLLYELNLSDNIDLNSIQWSSSNTSVLEVEKGLVKAKDLGQSIITAWIKNKSESTELKVFVDNFKVTFSSNLVDIDMKDTKEFDFSKLLTLDNITKDELVWSSTNAQIATVDQKGVATAFKDGITTIELNLKGSDVVIARSTLRVKGNEIMELYIIPKHPEDHIIINQKYQYTATVFPGDMDRSGLKWSVSDTKIANIDQTGLVYGVSLGEVIITVTAPNGVSYSRKIQIISEDISFVSIVNYHTKRIISGESLELNISKLPYDADLSLLGFTSSNPSVATVDFKGVITTVKGKSDSVTITVYSKKDPTIKDTITLEVVSVFYGVFGQGSFKGIEQNELLTGDASYHITFGVIETLEISDFKVYTSRGVLLYEDIKPKVLNQGDSYTYNFTFNKAEKPYVTYKLRHKDEFESRRKQFDF